VTTHRSLSVCIASVVCWTSGLCFTASAHAAPLLTAVFPLSCEPGKTVTVSLAGKQLENAKTLVFSIPEVTAALDDAGKLVVSVAAGTPPQDCDVWCVAAGELSNPRRFVVSTLASVAEASKNDSFDTAQTIPFPGAVDGRLEAVAKLDWFQFEAKEGQTITLSCRSRSLDGSAQPAITLFSPAGREIAHSTGRRLEPLLSRRLSETGTYRIRVSDSAYRTAADSVYRLELLAGPQIISAWPDLIQRSASPKPTLSLFGHDLPGDSEPSFRVAGSQSLVQKLVRDVPLPADSLRPAWQSGTESFETSIPLSVDSAVYAVSGSPRIRFTDQEVAYEDEDATKSLAEFQQLPLPTLLNGRFNTRNDVDWYAFDAKKGETFRIDVYGDRRGHLLDLDAVIMDAAGKTLVTFPDTPTPKDLPSVLTQASLDVAGTWTAPADGTFHLVLRDLYGSTLFGVDRTYVLSLRRAQPSFDLVITPPDEKTPTGYSIPQNGRTAMRVSLLRRDGFAAAVRLRLSEANRKAGLKLDETWIGPGESSALAILSNSPGFETASPIRFLELEAVTETEPAVVQRARAITLLRAGATTGRFMNRSPVAVSRELPLAVALSISESEIKPGGKLTLTLKHTLTAGSLKADAKVEFPTLPSSMKAPAAAIKAAAEETNVAIVVPGKLPMGHYSLAATVSATVASTVDDKPMETALRVWSNSVSFQVIPKSKPDAKASGK
jgi:hypothetical protein